MSAASTIFTMTAFGLSLYGTLICNYQSRYEISDINNIVSFLSLFNKLNILNFNLFLTEHLYSHVYNHAILRAN